MTQGMSQHVRRRCSSVAGQQSALDAGHCAVVSHRLCELRASPGTPPCLKPPTVLLCAPAHPALLEPRDIRALLPLGPAPSPQPEAGTPHPMHGLAKQVATPWLPAANAHRAAPVSAVSCAGHVWPVAALAPSAASAPAPGSGRSRMEVAKLHHCLPKMLSSRAISTSTSNLWSSAEKR